MSKQEISVFWFRRDLRLEDNHGLYCALKSGYPVLPFFLFDKYILDPLSDRKDKRVNFIYQTLLDIQQKLIVRGSSLYIVHETPVNAFKQLIEKFEVKEVYTNQDYEPYAIARDKQVSDFLQSKNIPFHSFKDQVIFEKSEIAKPDEKPYTIFTPYSKQWKGKYKNQNAVSYRSLELANHFLQTGRFSFPSLRALGFKTNNPGVQPAEIDRKIISSYAQNRDIPWLSGTTRLSVHLRFGTISIRKLAKLVSEQSDQLLTELIWREFFMMILFHFPRVVGNNFRRGCDHIQWRNNEKEFEAWCKGETGYPIVDAGMRELNATGFVHNRIRMIVASFLTKHLLIDWRWGEGYFAEKLLDYDLSSNNGNWQWVASSGCDAAPYFRIFNPAEQTKRFDPKLLYVRKWVSNFESYDIPPIVEHEFARRRALSVYRAAYEK